MGQRLCLKKKLELLQLDGASVPQGLLHRRCYNSVDVKIYDAQHIDCQL